MNNRSDYFAKLCVEYPDVAERYERKIRVIDGIDPFTINNSSLSVKPTDFPVVTNMDLVAYLVLTTSFYTKEQMKAFKSLNAYKYFKAGFVTNCGVVQLKTYKVVIGKVKHSQRLNDPDNNVWIIVQEDGSIETAHCTCMAGAGEVCSHVGAVLYALQLISQSQSIQSCTDVRCLWNVPKMSDVRCATLKSMDFGRKIVPKTTEAVSPVPAEEIPRFLQGLKDKGCSSVLMRVVEPFASELCTPSVLVNPYRQLYNSEYETLTSEQLIQLSEQYVNIALSVEECNKIEENTRDQSHSSEWFNQRAGRITASKLKQICHTSLSKPSLSLIKQICYPTKFSFRSKETEWGLKHESVAVETYYNEAKSCHEGIAIQKTGLIIKPDLPQFGASPDTLVRCSCCGSGCVEVKCPFLLKFMNLQEYASKKSTCLLLSDEGEIYLNNKHMYFYQIQQQMALTSTTYCDFVIWSPKEIFVERVPFNEDFWAHFREIAKEFHKKVIMPELLGRLYTQSDPNISTWCVCNEADEDRPMIRCANEMCSVSWYHMDCVDLSDFPNNVWFCQYCSLV